MVKLHETRLIDRPIEEVFEYTSDFNNIEDWDPGISSSSQVDAGPVGVGSRFELGVAFGARRIPMTYEITEYQPNERVVIIGKGSQLEAVDEIRFEERDGQTMVDYTADLKFHNYVKYLAPFMGPIFKKVGERAVDGLKESLEK
jgi:dehydrogenase/reductase SDR family protein 12